MTEEEWLTGQKRPLAMFDKVRTRSPSPRKLQLFAVAACRLGWGVCQTPALQLGLEVLENYAEGFASEEEFTQARGQIDALDTQAYGPVVAHAMSSSPVTSTRLVVVMVTQLAGRQLGFGPKARKYQERVRRALCRVLREIFGNPFRPYLAVPSWQGGGVIQPDGRTVMFTDAVKGIADAVHITGDFGRLPILADALEEAGVTDEVLLAHCRDGGPHLRGCWALDVVRGRA